MNQTKTKYIKVGTGIVSKNKYHKPNSKLPLMTGTILLEEDVNPQEPIKIAMWRSNDGKEAYGIQLTREEEG